jgi:hypothetical protein
VVTKNFDDFFYSIVFVSSDCGLLMTPSLRATIIIFCNCLCLLLLSHHQIRQIALKDEGWYDCQVNTEPKLNSKSFLKVVEKGVRFDGMGKSWRIRQSSIQESTTSPSYISSISLSTKSHHQLQDSPLHPRGVVPQIQEFLQRRGEFNITIS